MLFRSTITDRYTDIERICASIKNIALLHNHVVIVDGIAIVGANCWYSVSKSGNMIVEIEKEIQRNEDILYLQNTIGRLQLHLDVKKVIIVTNSVPGNPLFFGEIPIESVGHVEPREALLSDMENKVSHWVYGTYDKHVDTIIDDINYVNNSYYKIDPYWAKRIDVEI